MNRSHTALCGLTLAAITTQFALLEPSLLGSPYTAIGERNVFGLKDPPAPEVVVEEKPEEPPPNIKVTGITTISGIPRALLKVQIPAKAPEPAREESYILIAGGLGQQGIEVLEIDQAYGEAKEIRVKVRQAGKESWLGLEKDTVRAAAAPPPGAAAPQVAAAQAAAHQLAAARAASPTRRFSVKTPRACSRRPR